MDLELLMGNNEEKPLERLVSNGGFCGIFRTIACIGDSLSSGEFESYDEHGINRYHDYFEYSWGKFLERDAGCQVYNFSKGGMTTEEYCEVFADSKDFWNITYRAQAYIVALGVNDVSRTLEGLFKIGDLSDIDFANYRNNKKTFIGYYAQIVQRYKEIQPKAKFFFMTMPRTDVIDERSKLYDEVAVLLRELADKFENCYVLDLRKNGPVYDQAFKEKFYLGGHMNAMGYRLTALMVETYMDYIIRHNMKDFKQIAFVGTPYSNLLEDLN